MWESAARQAGGLAAQVLTAREGDEGSRRSADRTLTIGKNLNPTRVLFYYFLRLVNKKWEPQYKGQKGGKILKQNLVFSYTFEEFPFPIFRKTAFPPSFLCNIKKWLIMGSWIKMWKCFATK